MHALPIMVATLCTLAIGYRFYSAFIAAHVLVARRHARRRPRTGSPTARTSSPTNRWVLFGHHFAAITGAGPLIGPVLAAQFGFLPGLLWILIGVTLGGAVHDFVILASSVRRNGKSLAEIAREEIGPVAGVIAAIAIFFTVIIAIAAMGFAVVNILAESSWATFTIGMTIPIALVMGARACAAQAATAASATPPSSASWRSSSPSGAAAASPPRRRPLPEVLAEYAHLRHLRLRLSRLGTAGVAAAGAARLSVGLHEARHARHPRRRHHDREPRAEDGRDHRSSCTARGPIIPGKVFPFVFITIACGAISGFHSLIASGTTPKMIDREIGHALHRLRRHARRGAGRRHLAHRRRVALQGRLLRHQRRRRPSSRTSA